MPLSMIGEGETATITRVGGKEETRRFLENLGFVVGAIVTVISKTGGNVIVNIKAVSYTHLTLPTTPYV